MESNTESHNQSQWRVVEPSLLIDSYKISIFKIQGSLQKRKQKNYKRQKMGVCCEIISPNKQRIQAHKVWPVKCKLKKGDNNVSAKLHRKKSPWDLNPTLTHTQKENTQLRKLDQERWSVPQKRMQNVCPFPNGQSWKQTSSIKLTQPFLYKNMCVYPNTYICNINSW